MTSAKTRHYQSATTSSDASWALIDLFRSALKDIKLSRVFPRPIADFSSEIPMYCSNFCKAVSPRLIAQPCCILLSNNSQQISTTTDDPAEVEVVKQGLFDHIALGPRVTFSVLCDQLLPTAPGADEEEIAMRKQVRTLVVDFLEQQVIPRCIEPKGAAEDALFECLCEVSGAAAASPCSAI